MTTRVAASVKITTSFHHALTDVLGVQLLYGGYHRFRASDSGTCSTDNHYAYEMNLIVDDAEKPRLHVCGAPDWQWMRCWPQTAEFLDVPVIDQLSMEIETTWHNKQMNRSQICWAALHSFNQFDCQPGYLNVICLNFNEFATPEPYLQCGLKTTRVAIAIVRTVCCGSSPPQIQTAGHLRSVRIAARSHHPTFHKKRFQWDAAETFRKCYRTSVTGWRT